MANYTEDPNDNISPNNADALTEILHDLQCREVLNIFIDNRLLSIEEIFTLLSLKRHEVIVSLVKLCGTGLVKAFIADPYIFFGLGVDNFKKLEDLINKPGKI